MILSLDLYITIQIVIHLFTVYTCVSSSYTFHGTSSHAPPTHHLLTSTVSSGKKAARRIASLRQRTWVRTTKMTRHGKSLDRRGQTDEKRLATIQRRGAVLIF